MDKQKLGRVALLQVSPLVEQATGRVCLELWLATPDGNRVNIYYPCKAVAIRVALFTPSPQSDCVQQVVRSVSSALGLPPPSEDIMDARTDPVIVPRMGNALRGLKGDGHLLRLYFPTSVNFSALQALHFTGASEGIACLADASPAIRRLNKVATMLYFLRQELLFDLYDKIDLPLYLNGDVLLDHIAADQDGGVNALKLLIEVAAASDPLGNVWQAIPPSVVFKTTYSRRSRVDEDIILCVDNNEARSGQMYRTGTREAIVASHASLFKRVYGKTWIGREFTGIPLASDIQALLRICLATVHYAHCPLEDVLVQSRLFLAARMITHVCNREGLMPPSAIENMTSGAAKRPLSVREDAEGGKEEEEEQQEVEYKGGEIFKVTPGVYAGTLELLDFDTYYMSLMDEYGIFEHFGENLGKLFAHHFRGLIVAKRSLMEPISKAALKLSINVVYGCVGMDNSLISNVPLAAETTRRGRETIEETGRVVGELGGVQRYGHTDSVMVDTLDSADPDALCQAIVDRMNAGRSTVLLKRSDKFCFVWVQNRTRFIGIRTVDGQTDWTGVMDKALALIQATLRSLQLGSDTEDQNTPPSTLVDRVAKFFDGFAKFPGLLASNMPPAYKLAILGYTFTLMAMLHRRQRLETRHDASLQTALSNISEERDMSEFAAEVGEMLGEIFRGEAYSIRFWVHFTGEGSMAKAFLRTGGASVEARDLSTTAAACDCVWWKRRLNERLHQQVSETLLGSVGSRILDDLHKYIDILLPLRTVEETIALNKKSAVSAVTVDMVWADIVKREDRTQDLPDMLAMAAFSLGDRPRFDGFNVAKALDAIACYAKNTQSFMEEHPDWKLMATDAFAKYMLIQHNLPEFLGTFRSGLTAAQIRKAAANIPTQYDLQPLRDHASQQLLVLADLI